jgi:hypothetical protein
VDLIGAALGGDDDGGGAVEFRGRGAGFDANFADGIEALLVHGAAEFPVVGGGAVLDEFWWSRP